MVVDDAAEFRRVMLLIDRVESSSMTSRSSGPMSSVPTLSTKVSVSKKVSEHGISGLDDASHLLDLLDLLDLFFSSV